MKTTLFAALFAAVAASTTLAADVNVMGPRTTTAAMPTAAMPSDAAVNVMGAQTSPMMTTAGTDLRIASKDILNRATALLNKNTLAMDNNVFIARSNVVFTQNDRLAMRKKVEDAVMRSPQEQDMTAATLTKSVLRAVSAPDTDSAVMTKASGVVAAKGDPSALAARIAAFVDAVGQREMEQEQAIQSQTPSGIIVLIGTKDLLRQPTAVIIKNKAASDNQVTVSRSAISPTQNDQVVLTGGAKVADAVLPAAAINVGQVTKTESAEPMYRTMIAYPKEGDADAALKDKEQWLGGFGGLGWGLGYRYPLGYWNTFGAGLYGGGCGLGFGAGGFYYC